MQVITLLLLWCHYSSQYSYITTETCTVMCYVGRRYTWQCCWARLNPTSLINLTDPPTSLPIWTFWPRAQWCYLSVTWCVTRPTQAESDGYLMVKRRTTLSDSLSCLIEQHVTSLYSPGRTASGVITNYTEELSRVLFDLRSDKHLVFELQPCAPSSFTATHQTALSRPHRQQ